MTEINYYTSKKKKLLIIYRNYVYNKLYSTGIEYNTTTYIQEIIFYKNFNESHQAILVW